MKKIKSICIDTVTAIQDDEYMIDKKKPDHNKWKDWGQDIYTLILRLNGLGFEQVLVIGHPGTGKSSGIRTLEAETNIWYNADKKNPTWEGGSKIYGKKNNPINPYHVIPNSYDDIINHIEGGIKSEFFADERVAFVLGHVESYKEGSDTRARLKTIGNLATKMQIEGKLETVLYSKVEIENGERKYLLETQNNGYNTARSHQNMFEDVIENDYKKVLDKILAY